MRERLLACLQYTSDARHQNCFAKPAYFKMAFAVSRSSVACLFTGIIFLPFE